MNNLWKPVAAATRRTENALNQISRTNARANQLGPQRQVGSGLHPLKIYQFPREYRTFKNNDDYRRFKVRGGKVSFIGSTHAGEDVGGTDACSSADCNPYDEIYTRYSVSTAIAPLVFQTPPSDNSDVVPSSWNEAILSVTDPHLDWYFWISLCLPRIGQAGTIVNDDHIGVVFGQDPSTGVMLSSGEDVAETWPNFPDPDPYHIPIGVVDWVDGSNDWFVEKQYLGGNLIIPEPYRFNSGISYGPAMRFRGEWSNAVYYFPGDVVTETDSSAGSGCSLLYQFIYDPATSSAYHPNTLLAPLLNVNPFAGNYPDPWVLQSVSPIHTTPNDAQWTTGAYDASKFYYRTP